MTLSTLHTLQEVADSLGMSERWLRQKVSDGAVHTRLGNKIRFTDEQVAALVADHATAPKAAQSITTGKKRSA